MKLKSRSTRMTTTRKKIGRMGRGGKDENEWVEEKDNAERQECMREEGEEDEKYRRDDENALLSFSRVLDRM